MPLATHIFREVGLTLRPTGPPADSPTLNRGRRVHDALYCRVPRVLESLRPRGPSDPTGGGEGLVNSFVLVSVLYRGVHMTPVVT